MKRVATGTIVSTAVLIALSLGISGKASAAHPCKPALLEDGSVVRVATIRAPCRLARGIAGKYFKRIQQGDSFDGKSRKGLIYYAIDGFRCFTGLGGTQTWCHHHRRWVFASIRPDDHPSTWQPPFRASRGALAAQGRQCKDVMFIGARGSDQKANKANHYMGDTVNQMAKRMYKAVDAYGETMGFLPVLYRADSVSELVPSARQGIEMAGSGPAGAVALYVRRNFNPYIASINDGVKKTIENVRVTVDLCPETEIVLAGYSQGAMAIHQAELKLANDGADDALDAIGGTLLLGDGDRVSNSEAHQIGGAPGGAGVRVRLHGLLHPRDVVEPETAVEICAAGDLVCDFSLRSIYDGAVGKIRGGAQVHTGYLNNPSQLRYLNEGVDWLVHEMGLDSVLRLNRRHAQASQALRQLNASSTAETSRRRRDAISFRGIGRVRWGASLTRVEDALNIAFDCSEGLVPGHCLCPPSEPDLSLRFVFNSKAPQDARLQAVFGGGGAHTPAGIAIGSSKRAVEKAYPGARYKVNAPINSGLSTLLLARHNGHALLFFLSNGHVSGISAYADGSAGNLEAEQCA